MENYTGQMQEKRKTGAQLTSVNECETIVSLVLMIFKTSPCAVQVMWLLPLALEG